MLLENAEAVMEMRKVINARIAALCLRNLFNNWNSRNVQYVLVHPWLKIVSICILSWVKMMEILRDGWSIRMGWRIGRKMRKQSPKLNWTMAFRIDALLVFWNGEFLFPKLIYLVIKCFMYGFKHQLATSRSRLEESARDGDHGGSLPLSIKLN